MKITIKKNLYEQIKNIKENYFEKQIDNKNLYIYASIWNYHNNWNTNDYYIMSYKTNIAKYDANKNILYITSKKYSITTTKQQNQIKNNFIKYCNSKIVYTSEI